ncbi:hypothetical protein KIH39_06625 [Telmatocola sphagniphila]|jgi:hypothetical protein|uniref:Lipoprotein n=1 Tax=Telmatocola sphagniphila TaxID=1123043 RepID=A0A8E6B810_9BACT|nr:hypothetical protein [Telmatocola sphagniphila]QVL33582.1 hypothetical protein KIH39_06625 [Telmatocola sphagniphila]
MLKPILSGLIVLILFTGPGCSPEKPKSQTKAQVNGSVTLDGAPLKVGKITFELGDGTPSVSLDILDGKYDGRAPVGNNLVRLNATEKVSLKEKMKMEGPGYDQLTEVNKLPERYNTKSELHKEVVSDGTNTFNFDLKSK